MRVMPLIPGIFTSSTAKSYRRFSASFKPSWPDVAQSASMSRNISRSARVATSSFSSSTSNAFMVREPDSLRKEESAILLKQLIAGPAGHASPTNFLPRTPGSWQ
jgi:hypothetical protein